MSHRSLMRVVAAAALIAVPGFSAAQEYQEYVVQPGDTLMGIANAELGSPARWRTICDLNADVVVNCDRILPGTVLRLSAAAVRSEPLAPAPATTPVPPPVAEDVPEPVSTLVNLLAGTGTEDAVPGVLGEGGELPTGWRLSFFGGADGTAEVVAVSDTHVDVRVAQTAVGGVTAVHFAPPGSDYFPAEPGQEFQLTVELALIAGDLGRNGAAQLRGSERGESGSPLRAGFFQSTVELSSDLTRVGGSATIDDPEARFVLPDFRVPSNGPWEATFRIGAPEFGVLSE